MESDFRSDPMDTPEGQGIAKKAWNAYVKAVDRRVPPFVKTKIEAAGLPLGTQIVEDMIGFWVMWHLYGGFEGLEEFGMHKSTIWRKVARFRKMTGSHPDTYQMPGIEIDAKAYWAGAQTKVGRIPKKHT
jgi:hypothetical protein